MVLSNCAGVTRFCTKTAFSGRVRHPEAVLYQEVCKEPVGGKVLPVPRDLFVRAVEQKARGNLHRIRKAEKKEGGKAERLQRRPCACLLLATCGKRLGTLRGTGAQGIRTRRRYRRKSWGEMACCRSSMVRTKATGAP